MKTLFLKCCIFTIQYFLQDNIKKRKIFFILYVHKNMFVCLNKKIVDFLSVLIYNDYIIVYFAKRKIKWLHTVLEN